MIITFDCYGTLLNMQPIQDKIGEISQAAQLATTVEQAQTCFSSYEDRLMYVAPIIPYQDLLAQLVRLMDLELGSGQVFQEQLPAIIQAYRDLEPFPDVLPALRQLKRAGNQLYLMSNSSEMLMRAHLAKFGDLFTHIFLPEETGCYKPSRQFFTTVAQSLDLANQTHYHLANGFWWDVLPCQELHWPYLWINRQQWSTTSNFGQVPQLPDLSTAPVFFTNLQNGLDNE